MDATRLKLVAVDPTGIGRPVTLDIASDKPVDPELLPNGADVRVEDTEKPIAPTSSSTTSLVASRATPAAPTQSRRAAEKTGPSPAAKEADLLEASSRAKKVLFVCVYVQPTTVASVKYN